MRRKAKSAPEFFARRSHRSDGFVVAQKFLGEFSRRTGKPLTNLILRGQAMHWQTLDIRSRFGKCKKSNCSSQTLFTRTSDVFHTQKQLSRNTALPPKSNQGDKTKPGRAGSAEKYATIAHQPKRRRLRGQRSRPKAITGKSRSDR